MRRRVPGLNQNSVARQPLRLTITPQIAARNRKTALFQQPCHAGHTDAADAHQMHMTAAANPLLCLINWTHRYSPATRSSRAANCSTASGCARFFIATAIRSIRFGLRDTFVK